MMNLLINEMVKLNLITQTGESSLTEKLKQIRLEKLESSNDSGIAMIYSSYGFIDEIISSLGQVCLDDIISLFLYLLPVYKLFLQCTMSSNVIKEKN